MSPMSSRLDIMMLVVGTLLVGATILTGTLQGRPTVGFRAAGLILVAWLAIYAFFRFVGVPSLPILVLAMVVLSTMSLWAIVRLGMSKK